MLLNLLERKFQDLCVCSYLNLRVLGAKFCVTWCHLATADKGTVPPPTPLFLAQHLPLCVSETYDLSSTNKFPCFAIVTSFRIQTHEPLNFVTSQMQNMITSNKPSAYECYALVT